MNMMGLFQTALKENTQKEVCYGLNAPSSQQQRKRWSDSWFVGICVCTFRPVHTRAHYRVVSDGICLIME